MDKNETTLIEFYVQNNLPQNFNLDKMTDLISDLLDEDDKAVYYIPKGKISTELIFTRKKLIIAQRFSGEWDGDIILPYEDIYRLNIKPQNRLLFIKLDLMVEIDDKTFYIKKSEVENFRKLMWNIFEIK